MKSLKIRKNLLRICHIIGILLVPRISAKQFFKQEPQYTEVNPGGTVVLDCVVAEKNRNSECIWQHDGLPVLIQNGKYEWSGTREAGDCSLRILRANIVYDDGDWECQVTRSSYEAGDGLSSPTSKLVVRQPPSDPKIFKGEEMISLQKVSVESGKQETLKCESRGGNPAPLIIWYLDNLEVSSNQRNETELGSSKRWTVISTLEYTFRREDNGKVVRCTVHHEALTRKVREQSVLLDIQYPPSIRLERSPDSIEVEDGVDTVVLMCIADGNPKPDIVWRKLGQSSIFRIEDKLKFDPVRLSDSGSYICLARNDLGASDEISANIEVRFPPRNVITKPADFVDLEVGARHVFNCESEGFPAPDYEWMQKVDERGSETMAVKLGAGREIVIENVTYEHEGLWRCLAHNTIKGDRRQEQSPVLRVGVSGKPLLYSGLEPELRSLHQARLKENAEMKIGFCSDPPPSRVRWEWGSVQLEQGGTRGRISVADLKPSERKDCYTSTITFNPVTSEDARTYYLVAENERGELRNGVKLTVTDPISMGAVIGIAVSCLVLISFLLVCIVCSRKHRSCCFKDTGTFQPQDIRIERRIDDDERSVDHLEIIPSNNNQGFSTNNGLGQEVTYKGHAGVGRPVPAPFCTSTPSYLYSSPRREELIQPKKVRGTPTMYADLQFPTSSNFGSMKRRSRERETDYVRIKFNPHVAERAEL